MTWARFDDRYPWHRKVRGLSDAAFRMDVSAVCWCAENLTNGVIEAEFLTLVSDVRNPRKAAAELVRSGRWHDDRHDCEACPDVPAGAHIVHDYLDYNPTRDKVERDREQRRKAGEKGGVASGRARSKDEASRFVSAERVVKQNGSKPEATAASSPTNPRTRTPSPTTNKTSGGNATEVDAGDTDDPPRCSKHQHMRREDVPDCWACGHKREQWETAHTADEVFERPSWCGDCNEFTRLVDSEDDDTPSRRCVRCHPLAAAS